MNEIEISSFTEKDFIEIKPILNTDFDDFWEPINLMSELENENSKCIVAKLDKKIVGFACIWFSVDDAHITNIVVHKSFRHMGVGTKLLEKIIQLGKHKSSITLEVNTKNINAQKLYLKFGFKNLGIRKKYYKNVEDAYIMTLHF